MPIIYRFVLFGLILYSFFYPILLFREVVSSKYYFISWVFIFVVLTLPIVRKKSHRYIHSKYLFAIVLFVLWAIFSSILNFNFNINAIKSMVTYVIFPLLAYIIMQYRWEKHELNYLLKLPTLIIFMNLIFSLVQGVIGEGRMSNYNGLWGDYLGGTLAAIMVSIYLALLIGRFYYKDISVIKFTFIGLLSCAWAITSESKIVLLIIPLIVIFAFISRYYATDEGIFSASRRLTIAIALIGGAFLIWPLITEKYELGYTYYEFFNKYDSMEHLFNTGYGIEYKEYGRLMSMIMVVNRLTSSIGIDTFWGYSPGSATVSGMFSSSLGYFETIIVGSKDFSKILYEYGVVGFGIYMSILLYPLYLYKKITKMRKVNNLERFKLSTLFILPLILCILGNYGLTLYYLPVLAYYWVTISVQIGNMNEDFDLIEVGAYGLQSK